METSIASYCRLFNEKKKNRKTCLYITDRSPRQESIRHIHLSLYNQNLRYYHNLDTEIAQIKPYTSPWTAIQTISIETTSTGPTDEQSNRRRKKIDKSRIVQLYQNERRRPTTR